jgi:hypothetical protein
MVFRLMEEHNFLGWWPFSRLNFLDGDWIPQAVLSVF